MRLWHKALISVLPKRQLLAQWRECCCIAKNIAEKGTPNHILVNKIMNYSRWDFIWYSHHVYREMIYRGYNVNAEKFNKWVNDWNTDFHSVDYNDLFKGWHNNRYFLQCFYNLEEKYDCGGISDEEWDLIVDKYNEVIK